MAGPIPFMMIRQQEAIILGSILEDLRQTVGFEQ